MVEDIELLRTFARDHSEPAFAELVRRHIDLVYAFALRRVNGDTHLADDVTQSVFVDLARKAAELQNRKVLTGWLYTSTRFTAAKAVRSEQRRRTHEQEAHTMQQLHAEPTPAWEQIRPVLDHVMDQLNEPDREALLLRFFEGRPLAEIGRRLAVSEDAARMRIDRALEKTRGLLARHGITSTSAALAAALSAQPALAAPAGLAGAVTTGALATLTASGAGAFFVEATKTIAMSTLQKAVLAGTFALLLAVGLFEVGALRAQRAELDFEQQENRRLQNLATLSWRQRIDATSRLASLQQQISSARLRLVESKGGENPALEAEVRAWFARVEMLRQSLAANPAWRIPELDELKEIEWISTVQDAPLDTPTQLRAALAELRKRATNPVVNGFMRALTAYTKAHAGWLPENLAQLQPYLDPPWRAEVLDRYELFRFGKVDDLPPDDLAVLRDKKPVDLAFDTFWRIGPNSFGAMTLDVYIGKAQAAYAAEHTGIRASTPEQLIPYMETEVDPVDVALKWELQR